MPAPVKVFAVADTVPEGCAYITAGKRYEARSSDFDDGFWITSDSDRAMFCTRTECAHLDGGNWRRIEEPTAWPADKLDAVADAAMAEPFAIDWSRPIELDTVPPRPAQLVEIDDEGDAVVRADWKGDGCQDEWYVDPNGSVGGTPYKCPHVRNIAAMADPRDALIAELVADLNGIAAMARRMANAARAALAKAGAA